MSESAATEFVHTDVPEESDRALFLSELRSGRTPIEAALSCAYFGTFEFKALHESDAIFAAEVGTAWRDGAVNRALKLSGSTEGRYKAEVAVPTHVA